MKGLEFAPVTPKRWQDLEQLFGRSGACGGCWCMWWRITASEYSREAGKGNRKAMKKLVDSGEVPGILAYADGRPVAWCSVAPRERFGRLERSPVLKRVDETPVWSVVCFYVSKEHRRKGMMVAMLKAALEHARRNGASVVEGYPVEPRGSGLSGFEGFTGIVSAFRKAGFVEAARRRNRPIMRSYLEGSDAPE